MWSALRHGVAVMVGALTSIVLAYVGAVVHLLIMRGIPLGATPRETTSGEYMGLLAIVGVAAAIGGRTAVRAAPQQRRAVTWLLATTLALTMLWGFSGSRGWPAWWAPVVALTFAAGVWLGALRTAPMHRAGADATCE